MFRRADAIIGYSVQATDGDIGTVHDLYFDDETWLVRYIVVDTGPWLFGRRVLVPPSAFEQPSAAREVLLADLTQQQIKDSPEIDLDKPVSRQQEVALHDYFRWPYYWIAVPSPMGPSANTGGVLPMPAPQTETMPQRQAPATEAAQSGDPRLRSIKEVTGYHIQATDGEIGHVEDFFVDDLEWSIRYLLVDTRNWLPGRSVLISPAWIDRVSWDKSKVFVTVPRAQVEASPEYVPGKPPSREYEEQLFRHYGTRYYWL